MTLSEVAADLTIPIGTVKGRLSTALRALRALAYSGECRCRLTSISAKRRSFTLPVSSMPAELAAVEAPRRRLRGMPAASGRGRRNGSRARARQQTARACRSPTNVLQFARRGISPWWLRSRDGGRASRRHALAARTTAARRGNAGDGRTATSPTRSLPARDRRQRFSTRATARGTTSSSPGRGATTSTASQATIAFHLGRRMRQGRPASFL